jgi:acetyltransferase-like isoleucine patch superfamily enzyme
VDPASSDESLFYRGFRSRIYETAKVIHPDRLFLGDCAVIGDFAFINASGIVSVGCFAHLAVHSVVVGGGPLRVGDFSELSYGVVVITGTDDLYGPHLFTPGVPQELREITRSPVEIGRLCAIGARCIVCPGAVIGDGALIQPGTIVQGKLEPWQVYQGPSCRGVGERPEKEALLALADQAIKRLREWRSASDDTAD